MVDDPLRMRKADLVRLDLGVLLRSDQLSDHRLW